MKRTKIGKAARIPSPFDTSAYKTERSAVAVLMRWMREIIEQKNLDLGLPELDSAQAKTEPLGLLRLSGEWEKVAPLLL